MALAPPVALLESIDFRVRIARRARAACRAATVVALGCCLAAVLARLTGIDGNWGWWWYALPPALAALIAAAVTRAAAPLTAARLADQAAGTADLFVTIASPHHGAFAPMVATAAAQAAATLRPATVAPWRPWPQARWLVAAAVAGTAILLFVPHLDPFHRQEARLRAERSREILAQQARQAQLRASDLQAARPEAERSAAVEQALTAAVNALQALPKADPQAQARLAEVAKAANELLKERLDRAAGSAAAAKDDQGLGQPEQQEALRQQLAKGDTAATEAKLTEVTALAQQLAASSDEAERQVLRRQLDQKLKELAGAAGDRSGLGQALAKAMDQLGSSASPELAKAAMEALADSLSQAQLEAKAQGQNARDLQALKDALKTLQAARQAAKDGKGGELPKDGSLADYAKFFAEELAKKQGQGGTKKCQGSGCPNCPGDGSCQGNGNGSGKGEGWGKRDAPDDPSVVTDFTPEQAASQQRPGKILMQWKAQGAADPGKVEALRQAAAEQSGQHVSEALVNEQVPPGYHEAVREYFAK